MSCPVDGRPYHKGYFIIEAPNPETIINFFEYEIIGTQRSKTHFSVK